MKLSNATPKALEHRRTAMIINRHEATDSHSDTDKKLPKQDNAFRKISVNSKRIEANMQQSVYVKSF